jgi:hypothetical protein
VNASLHQIPSKLSFLQMIPLCMKAMKSDSKKRSGRLFSFPYRWSLLAGGMWLVFLNVNIAAATTVWTVKKDGTGNFTTIQAGANAAQPGDTCLVSAGTYDEHAMTARNGSGESGRITFKADGLVTMKGFDIKHSYITVDGFDITGYTSGYQGHITIMKDGHYAKVLNNTIRDGLSNIYGILFLSSSGMSANGCVVSGNTLRNLKYMFLSTNGGGHTFSNNIFEHQNSMDYIRLFGHDHVIRRNIFRDGNTLAGTGNHPDFVQTFGDYGAESYNMLFEENWIQDLESQMGQLNSQTDLSQTVPAALSTVIHDWVFKNNVFIRVSNNMNVAIPGIKFINNTFYRIAYTQSGLGFGGSLKRGDASNITLKNNVFLEGGVLPDPYGYRGYYGMAGGVMSREVLYPLSSDTSVGSGIFNDMVANGYIDSNGGILSPAKALSDISQFVLNSTYGAYKAQAYDLLIRTVQLDASIRSTFVADYNYVAESAPGYAAKVTHPGDPRYEGQNFVEIHGINGGDPKFQNVNNPLGPDGIPFTLDDGLKPLPTSLLRGNGEGGVDVGAYSADPNIVFAGSLDADTDNDGLVDTWEIQYFGSISDPRAEANLDVDGDGLDNLAEQTAETSPVDRSSTLRIISQSLSEILGFSITWQSVSNKTYEVESSSTLTNWNSETSVVSTSNSVTWTETAPTGAKKFYRVKMQ